MGQLLGCAHCLVRLDRLGDCQNRAATRRRNSLRCSFTTHSACRQDRENDAPRASDAAVFPTSQHGGDLRCELDLALLVYGLVAGLHDDSSAGSLRIVRAAHCRPCFWHRPRNEGVAFDPLRQLQPCYVHHVRNHVQRRLARPRPTPRGRCQRLFRSSVLDLCRCHRVRCPAPHHRAHGPLDNARPQQRRSLGGPRAHGESIRSPGQAPGGFP
mmetsp:Transcript_30963/g.72632  ORF Transcript_30963/g.72632 Transcript_30963/m.72632 type:complete len:213 (-) Transcript_30963:340-978(-)